MSVDRNLNRVADVWLDEYKELYYELRPNNRHYGAGDISDRLKLKSDLHCKSFKWFAQRSVDLSPCVNHALQ